MSLPKSVLTDYVGHLSASKRQELKQALLAALAIEADEE
jgi:mRNA-degrading endonuclease toxin of MazEF toxin-antitoxin module